MGKAFGAALTTGGTAAAQGIAMLNPQRWGGAGTPQERDGYAEFAEDNAGATLFDVGVDDDDDDDDDKNEKLVRHESKGTSLLAFHHRRCVLDVQASANRIGSLQHQYPQ
jgi:hypothetical protein